MVEAAGVAASRPIPLAADRHGALSRGGGGFSSNRIRSIDVVDLTDRLVATDASAPFNLGNMLRANGRNVEAEAALRAATRVDPTFADAWYNLGDLLDEQGRSEAAIEC